MTRPTIRTHPVEVTATGHLIEFCYDDGENDGTLVCAAHAGDVEPGTGEQAVELATRLGASCWACFGYDDEGAFDAFHPPSSEISPDEYPLLGGIADRGFARVLSLHGLDGEGVLVGGGIEEHVKRAVRDRLADALTVDVSVVSTGEYAGTSPGNFVNWLATGAGGVQLELSTRVRADESGALLDALAGLLRDGTI